MNPPVLKFTHPELDREVFSGFDINLDSVEVVTADFARNLYSRFVTAQNDALFKTNALDAAVAELQKVKNDVVKARLRELEEAKNLSITVGYLAAINDMLAVGHDEYSAEHALRCAGLIPLKDKDRACVESTGDGRAQAIISKATAVARAEDAKL